MKKFIFIAVAMLFSSCCFAAPDKGAATKWASEFHAAKSSAFDALVLQDPIRNRNTWKVILKLRDRAEKLFGNSDDCYRAASGLVEVYQGETELAMGSHNANIAASGLAYWAWKSGQYQDSCEIKIDALK